MALNSSAKNQHRHHLEAGSRQEDSISLNQSADPPSRPAHAPSASFSNPMPRPESSEGFLFSLLPVQFEANVAFCGFPTFQCRLNILSKYCPSCHSPILLLKSVWRHPVCLFSPLLLLRLLASCTDRQGVET